ncbi:hypothetical protein [Actinoallomurus sp. NPDC052274]|uniref:hypothetical protein n=1 Tax=Actinoallomurus sp. NPDC052274 TaxID=3155420 RepID=UPI0034189CFF
MSDPADVNADVCVARLKVRTAVPRIMTNFADPDNDGDAARDDDLDGDGRPWTTPVARLTQGS